MTTVRTSRSASLLAALGLLVALCGCGGSSSKGEVSGTIKLHGQPPKFAGLEIIFQAPDGSQTSAPIHEDGTYKADGVAVGENRVYFAYITPEAAAEGAKPKGATRMQKPGAKSEPPPKVSPNQPTTNPLREELREASTSKLTVKVESGKPTHFDYDLP